jgi:hypothetical protein
MGIPALREFLANIAGYTVSGPKKEIVVPMIDGLAKDHSVLKISQ